MRRFDLADLAELNGWYSARDKPPIDAGMCSGIGYIEPGVCAGFLFRTDSDVALLDGYIANPAVSHERRSQALDAVTEALLAEARYHGFRRIVALTELETVVRRAERWGLCYKGQRRIMVGELQPAKATLSEKEKVRVV